MWTPKECRSFFAKVFGLELTEKELEKIWTHLSQNHFTPVSRHGGNTVGFTPLALQDIIQLALEQTQSTLQNPRFKKVREEIMPAIFFTLLLKRLNLGEFIIVSMDIPDIALVSVDSSQLVKPSRRVNAVPLEAMVISDQAIKDTDGSSPTEKIANIIIVRKFNKRYLPQTILLVTLMAEVKIDIAELSAILSQHDSSPFDSVGIFIGLGSDDCVIATLLPSVQVHKLQVAHDLLSLMY